MRRPIEKPDPNAAALRELAKQQRVYVTIDREAREQDLPYVVLKVRRNSQLELGRFWGCGSALRWLKGTTQ